MANTGLKQATVAYKVRASDGVPLDTDNNPTVVNGVPTGRKQAIAILDGTTNPDPELYDVQEIFSAGAFIEGAPTMQVSNDCATGYLFLSEAHMLLQTSDPAHTIVLTSSGPWSLVSAPPGIATLSIDEGPSGPNSITFTRTATEGQGYFVFINDVTGQTAQIYVINVDVAVWVLETNFWDNLGIWFDTGIFNF